MKTYVISLLAAVLTCTMLASCTNKDPAFDGQASEILDLVISQTIEKKILADEELKDITCYDKPVDSDSCKDILGLTPADFETDILTAVESKPEGSWFAHSIVLVQCKDGIDVASLADEISQSTDPARFGCIKPEAVVVGYSGQFIVLCASTQNACDAIYTTFEELSSLPANRIDRENDWNDGGLLG